MDYFTSGLIVLLLAFTCVRPSTGSAWLHEPPSRYAAWNYQTKAPVIHNFRNLNCGGTPVNIEADGSRNCGLCGDPVSNPTPRPNEYGGKYVRPIIRTRYYESGQSIEISVWNSMPGTPGFYEFRLCPDAKNANQACLNNNLLMIEDVNSTNIPVSRRRGLHLIQVQLPVGVKCEFCLLQWRFRKENSVAGCDGNSWCGLGRGPQFESYNCADVMIGAVGQPKPDYIQESTYTGRPSSEGTESVTTTTPTTDRETTASRRLIFTVPTSSPSTGTITESIARVAAFNPPRLIIDSSGNPVSGVTTLGGGGSSSGGGSRLLVLLGLLPILGAVGLNSNANARIPLPHPLSRAPASFWAPNPPLSEFVMGTEIGFGNFGSRSGTRTESSVASFVEENSGDVTRMNIGTGEATRQLATEMVGTGERKPNTNKGYDNDKETYSQLRSMALNSARILNTHHILRRAVGGYGHKQAEYSQQGNANGAGMAGNNWTPQNTMPQNTVPQNTMPQTNMQQFPLSQNGVPQNIVPQAGYSPNPAGQEYAQSGNQPSAGWQGNNNWQGNGGMMTNSVPNSVTGGQMIGGQTGSQVRMPSGSSGFTQSQPSTKLNSGFTRTIVQNNAQSNSWNQGSGSTGNNIIGSNNNNNNNSLKSWMKQDNPMVHDWYNRLMGIQTGPVG